MRLSRHFWPLRSGCPPSAQNGHARMEELGMIHKVGEGLYVWSPLGLKSLKAVSAVVRSEQEKVGGLECMMTMIQPQALWKQSGRLQSFGRGLATFSDHQGVDLLCGPSSEEIMTHFFQHHVHKAEDLPKMFFQLQWKFQDQEPNNLGIFKSREFITQDGYFFCVDRESSRTLYERILGAYARAFQKLELNVIVVPGLGDQRSHQLVVLSTNVGDDYAFEDSAQLKAETLRSCVVARSGLASDASLQDLPNRARGISVGCLEELGTRYSEAMDAKVDGASGAQFVFMGAYRVNLSALTAVVVDVHLGGCRTGWPVSTSPFLWVLVAEDSTESRMRADALYDQCRNRGLDILYDDRPLAVSQKHLELDCLGLPYQVWVNAEHIHVIERASGSEISVPDDELLQENGEFAHLFSIQKEGKSF